MYTFKEGESVLWIDPTYGAPESEHCTQVGELHSIDLEERTAWLGEGTQVYLSECIPLDVIIENRTKLLQSF